MPRTKRTTSNKTKKTKTSSLGELHSTSIANYIERVNQSSRLRRQKEVRSSDGTDEDRPSTSGVVKKKRGLSHQPPKRKRLQTSNVTTTRRQAKRQKDTDDEEQYLERTVSAQAASRWKPLGKAARQFVLEMLDGAIVNVLNETRPSNYDDVQDKLNILRQRIVGDLAALTVPNVRQPDYRHIEEQCHSVEVAVAEASNQVELLENEIEEQMRLIEKKQKLLEEMKSNSQDKDSRKKIHPILQGDNQDKLALPAVKPSKAKPQTASLLNPSASPSKTYHKRLVDALKKWQSQDTVKDFGTFMDTLSDVTTAL